LYAHLLLVQTLNVSYRRATHKAQNTKHCQVIVQDFQDYVKNKIGMLSCCPENVYNADHTNVYFSLESVYTYADTGSCTVSVKACDSNQRCTVMLAPSLTGEKVPYIDGLVAKELKRRIGYAKDVKMTVQEHAWFDEIVMLDWLEQVWKHEVAVSSHKIYYLMLDSCTIHMTVKVRQAFIECNTEVDSIPPSYTSKLQMLDVGVNCPFKVNMRKQFDSCICTNTGVKPTRQVVAQWIENA
jgi:DDE superfamily endonuclease